ncbi:TM2 domain-containing protein [Adlercreutzia sp. R21]|uniref:TM2 domain-containing protein n=1 Tax=Adlercreutzia wanghongyangiae TaxID=3111451 RepID=UPI002DBACE97|nr:TM2 domain-containing protein [Adlercreutzia sp. R21]MEC4184392.1 TM2 domain-containing protein [Adlercreutzia sp. R21]
MSFSYETPKTESFETQSAPEYAIPADSNSAQSAYTYQAPSTAISGQKSKVVAGLLAIFLGSLGVHKFYLGYTQAGIIMLAISLIGSLVAIGPLAMAVVALIEGILYLTKSDQDFYQIYVAENKPWL